MNQQRITKLQQQLVQQQLDGVILMPGPNSFYLSGMHTHVSERPVLLFIPQAGEPAVIIPGLGSDESRSRRHSRRTHLRLDRRGMVCRRFPKSGASPAIRWRSLGRRSPTTCAF